MNEPKKLIQIQIDLEHKKPKIQINRENLDEVLHENKQAFVIGILGRQQIGKSTFLRSSFDVKFKSSSFESQGNQTTEGLDIAVKQGDEFDLILIDAEGYRSSESIMKYQNQISWTTDPRQKRQEARNLSNFSSALQSVFLLEICDILLVVNEYQNEWQDFEEFIESFEAFDKEKRLLPQIIYLIKGADTVSKKKLAIKNLKQALSYENADEADPQNFDIENNECFNDINCYFLPTYSGDDSHYQKQNETTLSFINFIIQNEQDNLKNQIELKQQILAITHKLNQVLRISELKPLSVFDYVSIQYEVHFENEDFIKTYRELVQKLKVIQNKKELLEHTLNILDIPSKREILWESRAISHTMSGLSLGASAAGIGTASAALAGAAVVPIVGWIVAGVTISTLVAKIAVEQTVLKSKQEDVEKEVKMVEDFMQEIKQIMEVLQQIKEIIDQSSNLKRLLVFLIIKAIKEDADIQYSKLKQKVIEQYVKYNERDFELSMISTNISSEEFKFQDFGSQYFSTIGNNLSNGGIQMLQQLQRVEYLTRNSRKIYKVSEIGYKTIGELQTAQNLGGFASKATGADGLRLIGQNTKAFKDVQKFNVGKVNTVGGAAKVSQGFGLAFGVVGLALETYSVFQFEDDFNKKVKQLDSFQQAINELKEQLPNVLEFISNFESQALQYQQE
ncbi:UNKNOWN [Stylonychia lemnae]|uniref:Uncharacterized protein n=1 Tax=Stylonychia lemnae TaxID=5949 RepID=A0A077ZUU4_STYLE|nr:UNKNOWN [Stylonychia lemnae]|eukprot:CDW73309.1 UNKNOWN [Stylonychia lemnae]